MAKQRKKIKVVYRKLGKEQAVGQAFLDERLIEIDSRVKGRSKMDTIIHETLHIILPELSETSVIEKAREMTTTLWDQGYRQVDNKSK